MNIVSTPIQLAAKIEQINQVTVNFLRHQAQAAWEIANTPGQQQAVLDALGDKAAVALHRYGILHAALEALGAADGISAPDPEVFVAHPDGRVIYVPPAPPEP